MMTIYTLKRDVEQSQVTQMVAPVTLNNGCTWFRRDVNEIS